MWQPQTTRRLNEFGPDDVVLVERTHIVFRLPTTSAPWAFLVVPIQNLAPAGVA